MSSDEEKKESIKEICQIITKSVEQMLVDSNLGVEFALVVMVDDSTMGRLTACGSSVSPGDASEMLSEVIAGLKSAAAH